jgi:hypothetical protein
MPRRGAAPKSAAFFFITCSVNTAFGITGFSITGLSITAFVITGFGNYS